MVLFVASIGVGIIVGVGVGVDVDVDVDDDERRELNDVSGKTMRLTFSNCRDFGDATLSRMTHCDKKIH